MTDASVIFKTDYGEKFPNTYGRNTYGMKWDDTHSSAGKMTDASVIFKTDYGGKIPKNRAQCITVYKVRQ